MSAGRSNDNDLLGPPRSCRRLPARTFLTIGLFLLALATVGIVWKLLT